MAENPLIKRYLDAGMAFTQMTQARAEAIVKDLVKAGEVQAQKTVLSAGLGAMTLGPKLGFKAHIRPQRGQVLITEKLPKLINRPSLIARQMDEGGIQIGATNEEVGLDDHVTQPGLSGLAAEAIAAANERALCQNGRSEALLTSMAPWRDWRAKQPKTSVKPPVLLVGFESHGPLDVRIPANAPPYPIFQAARDARRRGATWRSYSPVLP